MAMMMSVLTNSPLPSADDLQNALINLGFEISLVDRNDLFGDGFRPMVIGVGDDAIDSGVEIYKSDARSFAKERELGSALRFGQALTCRWGGSFEEGFCGVAVCAALAKLTDGTIYSDYTGSTLTVEATIAEARGLLEEVSKGLAIGREWPAKFLAVLREQHHDYTLNPNARWPLTEVIREVDGLFHSHSSAFGGGEFVHHFAVTASLGPSGMSPFHGGSRFGGLEMPASHMLRRGYEDVIRGFATKSEANLAVQHRTTLKRAAPMLLRCLDYAARNPEVVHAERTPDARPLLPSYYPTAALIADPPREWRSIMNEKMPHAIVSSAREGFAACREEWPALAERLEALLR